MSDEISFPKMVDTILSEEMVRSLLADIEHMAQDIELNIRYAGDARAQAAKAVTQPEVASLPSLVLEEKHAVQIRYLFEGVLWCDTLIPIESGTRLVRVCLSENGG